MNIKTILRYARKKTILQYSPPRTGSTLLWNTLRHSFPKHRVVKEHSLPKEFGNPLFRALIICSVREPLDALASAALVTYTEPSMQSADTLIADFDRSGIWDVPRVQKSKRRLILKYEDFAFDFGYLFQQIETFMEIKLSDPIKATIRNEYSLKAVQRKASAFEGFEQYDQVNQIHGNHISRFEGRAGYYTELFGKVKVRRLYEHYREIYELLDYPQPHPCE